MKKMPILFKKQEKHNKDKYVADSLVQISKCLYSSTLETLEIDDIEILSFLCELGKITILAAQKQECITKHKLDEASVLLNKITDSLIYIAQTTPNHVKRFKNNVVVETREVYLPWNVEIEKLRTEILLLINTTKNYCEECGLNFTELYEEA